MNEETVLLRQVHPRFIQNGRVTSQAFRPTPKDDDRLSVYDGDQICAEDSWAHYTTDLGLASAGVLGVTVAECGAAGLPVHADPGPFPEHAVIDFATKSNSQTDVAAKALRASAQSRDWLYVPTRAPSRILWKREMA